MPTGQEWIDLHKTMEDRFGHEAMCRSSIGERFARALEGRRFGTVLEIGTFAGLSAVWLCQVSDKVITVDTEVHPLVEKVLADMGVADKVHRIVVPSNEEKVKAIAPLRFDMAFIDGDHTREGVVLDFDLVKRCGAVLFHDYPRTCCKDDDGATYVLDTLAPPGTILRMNPFAWWFSPERKPDA